MTGAQQGGKVPQNRLDVNQKLAALHHPALAAARL